MMENKTDIKKLIDLCDELTTAKMLFADQKINKILEAIAECPEVYELLSECMSSFNKTKEFDRAFTKDGSGKKVFVMPKEEYKTLALVFCLLADIGNGKIKFDELITTYFAGEENRLDTQIFMDSVVLPFKNLLIEAFNLYEENEEANDEGDLPLTEEEIETLSPEERLQIVPFSITRLTYNSENSDKEIQMFISAKDTASEMLERLCEDKETAQSNDVSAMLRSVIFACLDKNYDALKNLVCGLKYAAKGLRSIKYLMRELESIVEC